MPAPAEPTEQEIRDAIVTKVKTVITVPTEGRVWGRFRVPTPNNAKEYVDLYVPSRYKGQDAPPAHVWMVRHVGFTKVLANPSSIGAYSEIVGITHRYEIIGFRSKVDSEEDAEASENLFNADLMSISAAIDADESLGFDAGVSHSGFEVPTDMPQLGALGDYSGHLVFARLSVAVAEC